MKLAASAKLAATACIAGILGVAGASIAQTPSPAPQSSGNATSSQTSAPSTTAPAATAPSASASNANAPAAKVPAKSKTRVAQSSGHPSAPSRPDATSRPDAVYPNPSGQDSQPNAPAGKTADGDESTRDGKTAGSVKKPSKKASPPASNGTVESRGSQTANQSAPVRNVAKQKDYTGAAGKKSDPGTACSTARPTANGGLDCGTSGDGANPGKIPK